MPREQVRTRGMRPQTETTPGGSTGSGRGPALAWIATAPRPGLVLERLCPPLDPAEAAALQTAWLKRLVQPVPGVATLLYGTPTDALGMLRYFAGPGIELRPQPAGDRREVLALCFAELFAAGFAPVAVRNCVTPEAGPGAVAAALQEAARGSVVLAPDQHGDCWLIALPHPVPELFRDGPDQASAGTWSALLAQRATQLGLRAATGATAIAVRDAEDLWQLWRDRGAGASRPRLRRAVPVLPVHNLQAALQFYEVQFGCELLARDEVSATIARDGFVGRLRAGRDDTDCAAGRREGGAPTVDIEVADITAFAAELRARQVDATPLAADSGGHAAGFEVQDPDGNTLRFLAVPDVR